jgi:histone H3/H4
VELSQVWKPCSSCRKPIGLKSVYWTCNVSTCNRKRTGLVFCSVECWDAHVPLYNHRESWALENRAPKVKDEEDEVQAQSAASSTPRLKKDSSEREKFIQGLNDGSSDEEENERETTMSEEGNSEKEILVVASKLKNYIRAKSGMNTSAAVVDVLSDKIRELCDQAVEAAKRDGRKTVMDRDFG